MSWSKDTRYRAGGFWRCRIAHNARCAAIQRRRYDTDPIHRISRNLEHAAWGRKRTLANKRARLEALRGPL